MGSINSGRRNGKPLVEDCLSLDLAWLMRLGPIHEGQAGSGEVRWSSEGNTIGHLQFRLDLRNAAAPRLVLGFQIPNGDCEQRSVRQAITLKSSEQHFGGRRWWMICPKTGMRARTLHLPSNGDRFASRAAWGLAYRVERLSHFDRPFEKLFRAQRRIGDDAGIGVEVKRPKGMWRQTFARQVNRLARHDIACAQEIAALVERA